MADDIRVKITADTKDAVKDVKALDENIKAVTDKPHAAKVTLDMAEGKKLTADIHEILTEAEQNPVKIKVETDTEGVDKARHGVDEIGKSASSSKNALANMIGNTAQDLGALGGAAGSAGVAIGQMAEFMADAAFEGEALSSVILSFAKIAAPIAALTIAFQVLNKEAENVNKQVKNIVEAGGQGSGAVKAFGSAMDSAARNALDLENNLNAVKFTLGLADWDNTTKAIEVFNKVLSESPSAAAALVSQLEQVGAFPGLKLTAKQLGEMNAKLVETLQQQTGNTKAQNEFNQALKDSATLQAHHVALRAKEGEQLDDFAARLRQAAFGYDVLDEASTHALDAQQAQSKAAADFLTKQAEGATKAKDAIEALGGTIDDLTASLADGSVEAKDFGDAIAASTQAGFAVHEAYADSTDAIDKFGTTIHDLIPDMRTQNKAVGEGATHITTYTEAGRKALKATEGLASSVQDDLGQALKDSKGDYDGVRKEAERLRDEISKKLIAAGVDPSEVENFLQFLRLTKPELEVDIKVAQKKDLASLAQGLITSLQGVLDANPTLAVQVQTDLRTNPAKAVAELLAQVGGPTNPVVMEALVALPPDERAAVTAQLNEIAAANHLELKTDVDPTGATNTLGTWRVDEQGRPVWVPADATVDAASGTVAGWRKDEEGNWVQVPVTANMSAALSEYQKWKQGIESTVVSVPVEAHFSRDSFTPTMAGGPIRQTGLVRVGEAGPETVVLPGGSQVLTAGRTMMNAAHAAQQAVVINYHMTFNVPPTANLAEIGGNVVKAVQAFERRSGKGWRAA